MADMIDVETIQDPTLRQQILAAKAKLSGGAPVAGAPGMTTLPKAPTTDEGMQGFGKVNTDVLKNAASGMDDRVAFAMMNAGNEPLSGGGGLVAKKSPWEGVSNGVKNAIGTYGMLSAIKSKRDTAGELGSILSPKSKSKALRGLSGMTGIAENGNDFPLTESGELAIDS